MIPLSKINLRPPDFEWVAQVSLLRPGFLLRNRPYRATHSIFVHAVVDQDCAMTLRMKARFLRMSASNCFEGASASRLA